VIGPAPLATEGTAAGQVSALYVFDPGPDESLADWHRRNGQAF
jgi:hypothetical protein